MPVVHNASAGRGSTPGAITLFPLKSAALYSGTSMQSAPIGTAVGQDKSGVAKIYGGCAEKLYKLQPGTRLWTNISRAAGYATTAKEHWKFVEYGSLQIATNYNDEPQYIDMNVDVQFANLTTLVKGRHIATHKGFVILGNTYDSIDGAMPYRVRWSGIESPADWTFSPATMADFQDIRGYGAVQSIVTDDSAYILLQRGIVQMQFIGSPYGFQFTDRVVGKGCSVPESVISVEGRHFFLSDDGFHVLAGGNIAPISEGKISKWFLETADLTQSHLMTVAADPRETLVYWTFVTKNSVTGSPDMTLILNYTTGEWTTATATTHFVFNSISLPWTIAELDVFVSFDNVPASFDDPLWAGGSAMLFSMDSTGAVYSFSGPTLPLSIETPEYQLSRNVSQNGAEIAVINAARPLFEGDGTARIQVGTKKLPNSAITWSGLYEANAETGFAYCREKGRYQRFRMTLSGEWKRAFGLQIEASPAGKR